ncbi:MBL fold metallo-hydrolase [Azospirillum rugosum]|uniref:Glyoxylase-like metal-dependent hydrolase (Beta-lactamase superfamily II) n=1 Tax=Azospirillum rugosum TaxID=416170 RepID=A0ABS4SIZ2_9PROT|nr:MBL fold metallo-hydrolase [Azospirillum rugosum]MBP2292526.1 glyoxylase-like metal-dependent hydrolase (beta-lactamase superfamily II) [Azospirillum rugosum]MDQ0526450.1 glyoxylase-like metal-dependent hydrolase (beta-lactamase superfamily II) [Azospirillum rugosum]
MTLSISGALRGALLAMAVAGAAVTVAGSAQAAPPAQQRTQAPGFYRMALGDIEVTALYDGFIDLDRKILSGASAEDIQGLLARMFLADTPGVQTAVNAFLVHTGTNLVLVDTGTAKAFGPALGFIADNIRAAGYDPAQVDAVLLTHLHPDHANGLLAAGGAMAFPNAEVRVAKAEADFWLSEEVAAKAPADAQPFFAMARAAVAPYAAAGKLKPYQPGEALLPGVSSVAAPGHTPGHSGYLFSAKGTSILMWGDIVHSHSVQFARPEVAIEFDVDKAQAIETRKRLFADAAAQKLWVAGAHLPFPGIGHVRAEPTGYAWVPVEYGPIRTDR